MIHIYQSILFDRLSYLYIYIYIYIDIIYDVAQSDADASGRIGQSEPSFFRWQSIDVASAHFVSGALSQVNARNDNF